MCFNKNIKVLSIHYYDSAYSRLDYSKLVELQRYVDLAMVGDSSEQKEIVKNRVCLGRNKKLMAKRKPSKETLIQHNITHKIVNSLLIIDEK